MIPVYSTCHAHFILPFPSIIPMLVFQFIFRIKEVSVLFAKPALRLTIPAGDCGLSLRLTPSVAVQVGSQLA